MNSKTFIVNNILPKINKVLSPFRLKLVPKNTPNRDFAGFIKHLKKMNYDVATFVDVGVAFGTPGFYSSLKSAKFFLVEPVPQCLPVLKNLQQTIGADYFNGAAGSFDGEIDFFIHPDISGSSTLRQSEGEQLDGQQVKVPVKKLDSLIPKTIARPALLKIDTQGNELDVLAGAQETLENIDIVVVETSFHEFRKGAPEIHAIIEKMTSLGFRCYEILEGHYRAIDNALAQVDIAFVKNDSPLRASKCFFSNDQLKEYLSA